MIGLLGVWLFDLTDSRACFVGMLLRMFVLLYDTEVVEEEAFLRWKEDVSEKHPGKGKALFQVRTSALVGPAVIICCKLFKFLTHKSLLLR